METGVARLVLAIKHAVKDWTILIPIGTLIFILGGLVHGIRYAFRHREKK